MIPSGPGRVAAVLVLVLAGCAAPATDRPGSDAPGTTGETTEPTPTRTPVPAMTYPDPPSNRSAAAVERVVRRYDEARIHNALRTRYNDFSVGVWEPTNATVRRRTDRGVYVRVRTTYSYMYDGGYVDGLAATSLYLVNTTAIRRVNGTDLKLLDPVRGTGDRRVGAPARTGAA